MSTESVNTSTSAEMATDPGCSLANALKSPTISVHVGGGEGTSSKETFHVHTTLLSQYSDFFRGLLKHDMLEKNTNEVFLKEEEPFLFQWFISYIYHTGSSEWQLKDYAQNYRVLVDDTTGKDCFLGHVGICGYLNVDSETSDLNAAVLCPLVTAVNLYIMADKLLASKFQEQLLNQIEWCFTKTLYCKCFYIVLERLAIAFSERNQDPMKALVYGQTETCFKVLAKQTEFGGLIKKHPEIARDLVLEMAKGLK